MQSKSHNLLGAGLLSVVLAMPVWAEPLPSEVALKAEQGSATAMYQAGVNMLTSGEVKNAQKALEYLEKVAADERSPLRNKASIWLGRTYRDGLAGTAKNPKQAFQYFEQAAGVMGKDPEAQYELGKAYMNGMGTDQNLVTAYMWTAVSLHQKSSVEAEAQKQKKALAAQLNPLQLEKAQQLVSQIESIYLSGE